MRVGFKALVLVLAFAIPALASAEELKFEAIRAQQATIRAGVEAHSAAPYKELSAPERAELLARQATVLELINGKQSENELTDQQRTEVSTTLAWIDAKLKEAQDDRMVCERRTVLGSNRKERVCMTAAQMRAAREAARELMDRSGGCMDCKAN
ncbi:hypothetical protein J2X04_002721 [Lysobacter niabensis]|uniref:Lysozyme inhibitor LprI N-terminal domain-containing protein n=1 Tax=Agrilutibacter niabensis TaxID=380628 RepID=A0ABU1VSL0_9GAMM|nr:hypothetical protein [Lysobacter niabensis]MDR7100340.1 hypothetical protein [Lysobacter niabensis]